MLLLGLDFIDAIDYLPTPPSHPVSRKPCAIPKLDHRGHESGAREHSHFLFLADHGSRYCSDHCVNART